METIAKILQAILGDRFFLGTFWVVIGTAVALAPYCVVAYDLLLTWGPALLIVTAGLVLIAFGLITILLNIIFLWLFNRPSAKINEKSSDKTNCIEGSGDVN
jgi:predicted membrane protein